MKKAISRFKLMLFMILLLFMSNCQVDEGLVKKNNLNQIRISEKTFDELILKKEFRTVFEKLPIKNSIKQGKGVNKNKEDYKISDQTAKIVEYKNKISYTFLINEEKNDSSFFENLVIEVDSTKKTKAVIIKYTPTILNHKLKNKINFEGEIEVTPINNSNNS